MTADFADNADLEKEITIKIRIKNGECRTPSAVHWMIWMFDIHVFHAVPMRRHTSGVGGMLVMYTVLGRLVKWKIVLRRSAPYGERRVAGVR